MNTETSAPTQQLGSEASFQDIRSGAAEALARDSWPESTSRVIGAVSSVHGRRIRLLTDFARLTSGRYAAIQIETEPGRRLFVVATVAEVERGSIVDDGRERFEGLHPAFDAAHRLASRERHEERLRREALLGAQRGGQAAAA